MPERDDTAHRGSSAARWLAVLATMATLLAFTATPVAAEDDRPFDWPMQGSSTSSRCVQYWDPLDPPGSNTPHNGRDYVSYNFDTNQEYPDDIRASDGGWATKYYGTNGGAGNYVTMWHTNNTSSYDDGVTRYLHMTSAVSVSGFTDEGTLIGYEGATGGNYAKHLHFEIRESGNYNNGHVGTVDWSWDDDVPCPGSGGYSTVHFAYSEDVASRFPDVVRTRCDFDGDNDSDLVVGVPLEDIGSTDDAGGVYVFDGSWANHLEAASPSIYQQSGGAPGTAEEDDNFGAAFACGDFNADGFDDLAIGVPGEDIGSIVDAGGVSVHYGSSSGVSATGTFVGQDWASNGGTETGDEFGAAIGSGDFNLDGFDDLVVGAPGETVSSKADAGSVTVIYGGSSGLRNDNSGFEYNQSYGGGGVEAGDRFGASIAVGDFDRDYRDDIAAGAPEEHIGSLDDAGAVNILYAGATAIGGTGQEQFIDQTDASGTAEAYDWFGTSLAAGDFDGDGYMDLAVGAPGENFTISGSVKYNAGAVNELHGSSSQLSGDRQWAQNHISGWGRESYDEFGRSLTSGDFDGDEDDDLAVGSPGEDVGSTSDAGAVVRLLGNTSGGLTAGTPFHQGNLSGYSTEAGADFGMALTNGDYDGSGEIQILVGVPGRVVSSNSNAGHIFAVDGTSNTIPSGSSFNQDSSGVPGSAETNDRFGEGLS